LAKRLVRSQKPFDEVTTGIDRRSSNSHRALLGLLGLYAEWR